MHWWSRVRRTAAGSTIFARRGAPVVAVNDGKIVRVGSTKRLGRFVQLQDVYGNTYTYARLAKVARSVPGAEAAHDDAARQIAKRARAAAPRTPPRPRPRPPATTGRAKAATKPPSHAPRGRARPPRPRTPTAARPPSSACSPTRRAPTRVRAGGEQQHGVPAHRQDRRRTSFKSYFTRVFGLDRKRRRHQAPAPGLAHHRGHDPRPHRQDLQRQGAAHAVRDPPGRPRRAADRPEADPRRLEAARVDRDLPRRRARTRSSAPDADGAVDRPDPADEQGGAGPARARRPAHRDLRLRPPRHPRPARSTAACWRRSSSSPPRACGPRSSR